MVIKWPSPFAKLVNANLWCPSPKEMTQGPNQIHSAVFCSQKCPFHVNFGNLFHWYLCRNRYTDFVEFENVMKSTQKNDHDKEMAWLPFQKAYLCMPTRYSGNNF